MIERILRGAEGGRRTALMVALASTTWGFGIVSLAAGWKIGLGVLAAGLVTIAVLRAGASPVTSSAMAVSSSMADDSDDLTSSAATAEERVLARLAKMREAQATQS